MRLTKIFILLMTLLVSCSNESDETMPTPQLQEVVIGVKSAVTTRTSIDSDDQTSVRWDIGDQIAIWADGSKNANSDMVGQNFQLKYYGDQYSTAEFSTTTSGMSTDQNYTYRGFYPFDAVTIDAEDKYKVTYTIPDIQEGVYDGTLDFRVADPISDCIALDGTTNSNPSLEFRSITHALLISGIPSNTKKLYMTLPVNVVGEASFNMAETTAEPIITSSGCYIKLDDIESNDGCIMTLDLTNNSSDKLWFFMNPTDVESGYLSITAVKSDGSTVQNNIKFENSPFKRGWITPVKFNDGVIGHSIPTTTIKLSEDKSKNKLGENADKVYFTAPDGKKTTNVEDDSTTGVFSSECDIAKYKESFEGKTVTVTYESASAIVSDTITLDQDLNHIYSGVVPYLLFEDFSGISTFSSGDNTAVGGTDTEVGDDREITLSGTKLSGWTGDRVGGEKGKAIRITSRKEIALDIPTSYNGRLDSPALSMLKKATNIIVSYKYKGGRHTQKTVGGGSELGDGHGTYDRGWTTSSGKLSGDAEITNKIDSTITIPNTDDQNDSADQNFNGVTIIENASFEITGVTPLTRISWRVESTMNNKGSGYWIFYIPWSGNGNFWLYLDDITISIK